MPTFLLYIKADLENIAKIDVPLGHSFCIDVKESAGSETRERVHVTAAETHDMSGSKGTANFVMKFAKDSRHECSINVMQLKGVTRAVTEDDEGKFVPVMAFECRALSQPPSTQDGFVVTSKGGQVFDEVDLSEDWSEWDEKINESIGIYSVEAKFELHKGK
ncbi:hypothetical protein COO60DRAFT_1475747 [Scenedesmus sp. NREL 46B-D3]|nr:hypothetical protein COO60DRAFT_1475747 [Scenedesmus sp. NREL 46B-D3]